MKSIKQLILPMIPPNMQANIFLKAFGFFKVALIWYLRVHILRIDDKQVQIKIPLTRRSRNHLGSMYFGALAVGADCAGGLAVVTEIYKRQLKIDFVFKDFHADFLKRPDGDVIFTCCDTEAMVKAVDEAAATKERVNLPLTVTATVPDRYGEEVLARFKLTLSMKCRSPSKST